MPLPLQTSTTHVTSAAMRETPQINGFRVHKSTVLACSKDCGDMMSPAKRRLFAEPLLPEVALLSRVD